MTSSTNNKQPMLGMVNGWHENEAEKKTFNSQLNVIWKARLRLKPSLRCVLENTHKERTHNLCTVYISSCFLFYEIREYIANSSSYGKSENLAIRGKYIIQIIHTYYTQMFYYYIDEIKLRQIVTHTKDFWSNGFHLNIKVNTSRYD